MHTPKAPVYNALSDHVDFHKTLFLQVDSFVQFHNLAMNFLFVL